MPVNACVLFPPPSFLASLSDSPSDLPRRAVQAPAGWRCDSTVPAAGRQGFMAAIAGLCWRHSVPLGLRRAPAAPPLPERSVVLRRAAGGCSSRRNASCRAAPPGPLRTELRREAARTSGMTGYILYFAILVRLRAESRYAARAGPGGRSARAAPAPWRHLRIPPGPARLR